VFTNLLSNARLRLATGVPTASIKVRSRSVPLPRVWLLPRARGSSARLHPIGSLARRVLICLRAIVGSLLQFVNDPFPPTSRFQTLVESSTLLIIGIGMLYPSDLLS
jgi:hypothetical protein